MRYTHDCDRCVYVGETGKYDVYLCKDDLSVNHRYGDEPHQYVSETGQVIIKDNSVMEFKADGDFWLVKLDHATVLIPDTRSFIQLGSTKINL